MLEKITELIKKQISIRPDFEITEDTDFITDLRLDSYEIMELVVALEKEYGIRIEDEDIAYMQTVGDVISFIKSLGIDQ